MNRRRPPAKAVIVVVLLCLVAALAWWWFASRPAESSARAVSGVVEVDEFLVSPATAGRLATIKVGEGTQVKKGQVIATIDDRAAALQVTQAEQGVEAAKAQVTNARDNGTDADVTAAEAQVKQAEAAVDLAKLQRSWASVTAPQAGTVTSVTASVGQNTAPGATIARIVDPKAAFVRAYVPEPRLGEVGVGTEVTVTPTASEHAGSPVRGKVEYVSAAAEFTPNNVQTPEQRNDLVYEVRIRLTGTGEGVTAGLPVDVTWE